MELQQDYINYGSFEPEYKPNCITSTYNNLASCFGNITTCLCIPLFCCGPIKTIPQGYHGILTRFGIFKKLLYPGTYTYNYCTDEIIKVSLKTQNIPISSQRVMTKDNLTVTIDAVCFFNINNAEYAIFKVDNYYKSIENLSKTVLRTIIGENDLSDLFAKRTSINNQITNLLESRTKDWGIDNITVHIQDVAIPSELQRVMAKTAESLQDSKSKIITAEGEQKAAEIFVKASKLIKDNPEALELIWFNTLKDISKEKSNTIIVPNSALQSSFLNKLPIN